MNDIEIIDGEQGGDEWKALRAGVPTASNFAKVMAQGDGKTRDIYMRHLAGEIITGEPRTEFRNARMDFGNEIEPSLRATFEIETGLSLRQVAFVRRTMPFGVIGASPDSLIGDDGGLELKSAEPHILIDILRSGRPPGEHIAQVQGSMLVSGRQWWWLGIGYPKMPFAKWKIQKDTAYCARLTVGLQTFCDELKEMVAWLRRYGKSP